MSWNMLKGSNGSQQAWYSQRRQVQKGQRAADSATVCIKGKLFIGRCSLVLPKFDPDGNQLEEQWKVVD